jgi:hypothetical protein
MMIIIYYYNLLLYNSIRFLSSNIKVQYETFEAQDTS